MAELTTVASVDSVLVIADIARTLNDFRPLGETLDHICLRVSGMQGYDRTAIFMPGEDGDALVLRGSWGISDYYVDQVNRVHPLGLDPASEHGFSPTAEAFRSGRPVAISDVDLEPSFEPWREGARRQGYRSLLCVPVILRSQVIGVLDCYGLEPRPHPDEELSLLQLVSRLAGVAIETARIAEGQRRAVAELRDLSERLKGQNLELSRLSSVQARLTEQLVTPDATAVERTARTLAEIIGRSVLVAGTAGNVIAFAGPPAARETLAAVAARRDVGELLRRHQLVAVDGTSCVRLGLPETPMGSIALHPALDGERSTPALAAIHAGAVVTAELLAERADRALASHARPAVLVALAHGLYGPAQLREIAGVVGVPADTSLQLALLRCGGGEDAQRLGRRADGIRASGWPVLTAAALGRDVLVLMTPVSCEEARRGAARLRDRSPEVRLIGISSAVDGLAKLPAARREAELAAVVDGEASATLFEDLGPFGSLAGELPPGRAEAMVEATLGTLIEHDACRGTRLVETLAAYVDHGGRVHQAAAAAGIHPNTFHQRLRRAAQLGRLDLHDFRSLGAVVLALEWHRLHRARSALDDNQEDET